MNKLCALILLVGWSVGAFAQQIQRPTQFAGVSVTASTAELMAAGFNCAPAPGAANSVKCVNATSQGSELGVSFGKREVLLMGGNVILIAVYGTPAAAPGQVIQKLTSTLDASYKRVTNPRFLEMSDNQTRTFWRAHAVFTIAVSSVPVLDDTGRQVVRFAMFMPSAH